MKWLLNGQLKIVPTERSSKVNEKRKTKTKF